MSAAAVILMLIADLSGCVIARPVPYVRPAAGTGLQDRQQVLAQKEVRYRWWRGFSADGVGVLPVGLANYYESSGDTKSAVAAHFTNGMQMVANVLAVGGICYGMGYSDGRASATGYYADSNVPTNVVWTTVAIYLLIDLWAQYMEYPDTARSYNRYLAQDLDLNAQDVQAAQLLKPPVRTRKPRHSVDVPQGDTSTAKD
jgi:hypothetical protein